MFFLALMGKPRVITGGKKVSAYVNHPFGGSWKLMGTRIVKGISFFAYDPLYAIDYKMFHCDKIWELICGCMLKKVSELSSEEGQ